MRSDTQLLSHKLQLRCLVTSDAIADLVQFSWHSYAQPLGYYHVEVTSVCVHQVSDKGIRAASAKVTLYLHHLHPHPGILCPLIAQMLAHWCAHWDTHSPAHHCAHWPQGLQAASKTSS